MTSRNRTGRYTTCPTDNKVFLYYFTPPGKPRIAGELRLRVAPNDDSFESGSDLLELNGQPLCVLLNHYIPLYQKPREEKLAPDVSDTVLSTFPPGPPRYQFLYTLNDTVTIDFGTRLFFYVITEQGMESRIRWTVLWRTSSRVGFGASGRYRFTRERKN
jgi:hypothetical protein